MSLVVNPLQPFYVRTKTPLSVIQSQALTQLYQPLIGAQAVSVYFTLQHIPKKSEFWSQRHIHAQLIQQLNFGINDFDQARKKLEAVKLIRTYRNTKSNEEWQRQTLIYDVQLPLDVDQFLEHPLLNTALFNQIGDQSYYQLIAQFQVSDINTEEYTEISTAFNQVFKAVPVTETPYIPQNNHSFVTQSGAKETQIPDSFDYDRFLSYLMAEDIDHQELTKALKEEVIALHEIYGINEMEATQIVLLATNNMTGHVQISKLKEITSKKLYFQQKNTPQTTKREKDGQSQAQSFPYKYSKIEEKERIDSLKQQYPDLSQEDLHLILLCDQIPNITFIEKTKRAKNGFATDNEKYYVRDISQKTKLNPETINFLIYYLLVLQNRPNLYKNDLQRIANEWQQKEITSPAQAIEYIRQQEKIKSVQQKQRQYRNYPSKRQSTYREQIPEWMKQETTPTETTQTNLSEDNSADEAEIRARLDQLFNEEGN